MAALHSIAAAILIFAAAGAEPVPATNITGPDVRLRSDILEGRREAKLDSLRSFSKPALEKVVEYVENGEIVNKLRYGYHGFFPVFGGMSTNAELVFGILYVNRNLVKGARISWRASLSANRYQQYDAGLFFRRINSLPLSLELYNRYRNNPEEEHFGLGPDSDLDDGAAYRLEDYTATVKLVFSPMRILEIAGRTGYLRHRTDRGGESGERSVEELLSPDDLPAFKQSIGYWISEASAAVDTRDSRGNPRSGLLLAGTHTLYADQDGDAYDFRRSAAELQAYLPFLHKHRVLAVRGRVVESESRNGGIIPFNFMPHVGGANSIRGFEEYRFRDGKLALLNLEYRFEAFIGLDMALFGDFGQVAPRWENIKISEFETSYGGGLRFNTVDAVFLRFDIGHGREGTRYFLKFSNVF